MSHLQVPDSSQFSVIYSLSPWYCFGNSTSDNIGYMTLKLLRNLLNLREMLGLLKWFQLSEPVLNVFSSPLVVIDKFAINQTS